MPTFGFSAFLKLLCLNPKPQLREVRNRLTPRDEGGYDFHKSLRGLANRYIVGGEDLTTLMGVAQTIKKDAERASAEHGLLALHEWRNQHPGEITPFPPVTFTSPNQLFNVKFSPDFGVSMNQKTIAIHVWNTKGVQLDQRLVYAALSLLPELYRTQTNPPDDLAVLSLRDNRLYCLSEAPRSAALGQTVVNAVENIFRQVVEEGNSPRRRPTPGPFPPSPSLH